jgi:hypothetical protein
LVKIGAKGGARSVSVMEISQSSDLGNLAALDGTKRLLAVLQGRGGRAG